MIKLIQKGKYQLLETKNRTKILILDNSKPQTFAWINLKNIGEILVTSDKDYLTDTILSLGNYKLFLVKDEPKLVDTYHLELSVGFGKIQAYFLPTGLPDKQDKRNRIIPAKEKIKLKN